MKKIKWMRIGLIAMSALLLISAALVGWISRKYGAENVIDHVDAPNMGSEDFAYFVKEVPGAFMFLSSANPEKGTDVPHHNPKFNIDEDVLWTGSAMFVKIAEKFLG